MLTQSILASIAANPSFESKLVALSSCSITPNWPSVRTVVFRRFLEDDLVFFTDATSSKVKEIQANGNVEICWYFNSTREQYRIRAIAKIHDHTSIQTSEDRKQFWSEMTIKAKTLYLQSTSNLFNDFDEKAAFERFSLIIAKPIYCERLDLLNGPDHPVEIPITKT